MRCRIGDEIPQKNFKGCPLIGAANHKNLINGQFLEILDWYDDEIVLTETSRREKP
jgi:hypothetical protein